MQNSGLLFCPVRLKLIYMERDRSVLINIDSSFLSIPTSQATRDRFSIYILCLWGLRLWFPHLACKLHCRWLVDWGLKYKSLKTFTKVSSMTRKTNLQHFSISLTRTDTLRIPEKLLVITKQTRRVFSFPNDIVMCLLDDPWDVFFLHWTFFVINVFVKLSPSKKSTHFWLGLGIIW